MLGSAVNISMLSLRIDSIHGNKLKVFTETGVAYGATNIKMNIEAPTTKKLADEQGNLLGYDMQLLRVSPVSKPNYLAVLEFPPEAPEFE